MGIDQTLSPRSKEEVLQILTGELARDGLPGVDPQRFRIIELEQSCKDGGYAWAEATVSFIRDSSGKPTAILGVTRDIGDRKRAEQRLKKSEKRYRVLAENIVDIVWSADLDFKITYVSPSIERALGFTPDECIGRYLQQMITPASFETVRQRFREQTEGTAGLEEQRNRFLEMEVEYHRKDGSTIWMEDIIKAVTEEEGQLAGLIVVSRDITERRRLEKERLQLEETLRRSQKFEAIGTLAGGIVRYAIQAQSH